MILRLAVSVQYRRVSDGRTDRQTDGRHTTTAHTALAQRRALETDAARITKPNTEQFHDESWKPIYFKVKMFGSRSRVTKTLPAWVFAFL